jgi:hypothetical protein
MGEEAWLNLCFTDYLHDQNEKRQSFQDPALLFFIRQFMTVTHLERAKAFWAEMSAREHFVQIYQDEEVFVDTLASFVNGAFREGFSALVIATPAHRRKLEERLMQSGHDLAALQVQDQYISLDAEAMIGKFMINGSADDERFFQVAIDILARATKNGRKVRAFGETVAVRWAKGFYGATSKAGVFLASVMQ